MNVVSINTFNNGSTGKIMNQIAQEARKQGINYYTSCPRARDNYKKSFDKQIFIGNRFFRNIHGVLSKITGFEGLFSMVSTMSFLRKLDKISVDIIHLHNIHGSYINYMLLFNYIKRRKIKVIWTLHDCWSFTGRCPHFVLLNCNKWKNNCNRCPYPKKEYPYAVLDNSSLCYKIKKKCFTGVENMVIVTPSKWLAKFVKESFLEEYRIKTINNGIDLNVFKPYKSTFREENNIPYSSIMVLGVAFNWDFRKGLDVFVELSKRLDSNYKIVLVGTNEETEKKLPESVVTIRRTNNQQHLAEIYSSADILVNPTREDNFPTVNMEAIACGTPVVSFRTGGCPEMIDDGCGRVVDVDDVDALENEIRFFKRDNRNIYRKKCIDSSKRFDKNERIQEYISLYK